MERGEAKMYAAKTIIYVKQDGMVVDTFGRGIVDLPEKGRIITCGEPIATGIGL